MRETTDGSGVLERMLVHGRDNATEQSSSILKMLPGLPTLTERNEEDLPRQLRALLEEVIRIDH